MPATFDMLEPGLAFSGAPASPSTATGRTTRTWTVTTLGCIFLQDCYRIAMRKVTARHYNGDISWQICHDVQVEGCHSHDHAGLGLRPSSGSQRPVIRGNKLVKNDIGLSFCWGVKHGLAEKNVFADNRSYGISIGHRDTDNTVHNNDIRRSGKVGVLFRPERGKAFAPHRSRLAPRGQFILPMRV